jgi:hypothetical protein
LSKRYVEVRRRKTYVGSGSYDIDIFSTNTHIRSFYSTLFPAMKMVDLRGHAFAV